jgi:hypothetical protein
MSSSSQARDYIVTIEQKYKPIRGNPEFPTEQVRVTAKSNAEAISEARVLVNGVLGRFPPPLKYTSRLKERMA